MTKSKRIFLIVMALVLVCVISVTGTVAYLKASTAVLENTFTMGTLFDTDGGLELKESQAVVSDAASGTYTLNTDVEVSSNTYNKLVPGQDVPKDPFVRYKKLTANAYLYIGVSADMGTLSCTVSDDWLPLKEGTTPVERTVGSDTYKIYVYCGGGTEADAIAPTTSAVTVKLLNPETVTVPLNFASDSELSLSFTAYMCQSTGFSDALTAFNACFPAA